MVSRGNSCPMCSPSWFAEEEDEEDDVERIPRAFSAIN